MQVFIARDERDPNLTVSLSPTPALVFYRCKKVGTYTNLGATSQYADAILNPGGHASKYAHSILLFDHKFGRGA